MKSITLSIDEAVLHTGQEYAKSHNISFNALVRKLLEQTVLPKSDQWLEESFKLMNDAFEEAGLEAGSMADQPRDWTRDELYRV